MFCGFIFSYQLMFVNSFTGNRIWQQQAENGEIVPCQSFFRLSIQDVCYVKLRKMSKHNLRFRISQNVSNPFPVQEWIKEVHSDGREIKFSTWSVILVECLQIFRDKSLSVGEIFVVSLLRIQIFLGGDPIFCDIYTVTYI